MIINQVITVNLIISKHEASQTGQFYLHLLTLLADERKKRTTIDLTDDVILQRGAPRRGKVVLREDPGLPGRVVVELKLRDDFPETSFPPGRIPRPSQTTSSLLKVF